MSESTSTLEAAPPKRKSYYLPIEERLRLARLAIEGTLANPEIQEAVAEFGFEPETMQEGKTLLEEASEMLNQHKLKYGEQYEATAEINEAVEIAHKAYMKELTIARIALKNDTKADAALMLSGSRKQSFSGWLPMVRQYYDNLLTNPDWIEKMKRFKYDREKIEKDKALVNAVLDLEVKQNQKKGEAQSFTKSRDEKLDALYEWISDFKDIAQVALDDQPQLLEKLGFVVPS